MITWLTKRKWACVEKASLTFGSINIIASIAATVVTLATNVPYIIFVVISSDKGIKNDTLLENFDHNKSTATTKDFNATDAELLFLYVLGIITACVVIVVAHILLVFSALLVAGVCQKRAGFIKAFFYYGVITVPIALLLNVWSIAHCIAKGNLNIMLWIQIGILVVHMFFIIQLVVARKTYLRLKDPENDPPHTRLQESAYPII